MADKYVVVRTPTEVGARMRTAACVPGSAGRKVEEYKSLRAEVVCLPGRRPSTAPAKLFGFGTFRLLYASICVASRNLARRFGFNSNTEARSCGHEPPLRQPRLSKPKLLVPSRRHLCRGVGNGSPRSCLPGLRNVGRSAPSRDPS